MSSQGAGNGGGQAAGQRFVSFTKPAAQRIAKVVRTVEAGNRTQPGVEFDHPIYGVGNGKVFRVCTFTGAWAIGSTKTVTYKYQTNTPNTAVATNLFWPVTSTATLDCAIAKEGTAWFLIDVPLYTASISFITAISVGATLNTNDCSITTSVASSTATSVVLRVGVP
jgi:hypothetical protein